MKCPLCEGNLKIYHTIATNIDKVICNNVIFDKDKPGITKRCKFKSFIKDGNLLMPKKKGI